MTARRPAHLITSAEVDGWLADSVVTSVTYHRTSRQAARDIVEHGADIGSSWIGTYGQGLYSATVADQFFGEAEVAVAIRARNPLRGRWDEVGDYVDHLVRTLRPQDRGLTPSGAVAVRRGLPGLGYDGIVAIDAGGDGIDYVIAIAEGTVKVVIG